MYSICGNSCCDRGTCKLRRTREVDGKSRQSLKRQTFIGKDFGRAAAETFLITRLTFTLLSYLGIGYRWISRFIFLFLYALLLSPGFFQVAYYYYFSSLVHRSIVYGDKPRNRLDLYIPRNCNNLKPVVIFVTGGAWIIGYKAWGSLLGLQLAERGIIVACLDYRNFPQGTISDMVRDVSQGISFVIENISHYGGDLSRVFLLGQSAGAHVAACSLLSQAIKEYKQELTPNRNSWTTSQLRGFAGLSGGYNLLNLVDHFDKQGLYRSVFLSIMEGENSLPKYSPEIMIQDPTLANMVPFLPHIILAHGTADSSIPHDSSCFLSPNIVKALPRNYIGGGFILMARNPLTKQIPKAFVAALKSVGAQAELILFEGKTHTDLFIQDPLRGGRDELFEFVVCFVYCGESEAAYLASNSRIQRRLVPEFLLNLARDISPF